MSWLCSTLSGVLWDLGLTWALCAVGRWWDWSCCGRLWALQSDLVAVIPSSLFMLRYGGVALGLSYPTDQ